MAESKYIRRYVVRSQWFSPLFVDQRSQFQTYNHYKLQLVIKWYNPWSEIESLAKFVPLCGQRHPVSMLLINGQTSGIWSHVRYIYSWITSTLIIFWLVEQVIEHRTPCYGGWIYCRYRSTKVLRNMGSCVLYWLQIKHGYVKFIWSWISLDPNQWRLALPFRNNKCELSQGIGRHLQKSSSLCHHNHKMG